MSHMLCICGHDIADNTNLLPYAGFAYVVRDQNRDQFMDDVYHDLASFATALAEDRRETWIIKRFGNRYPRDLANRDVLEDAITDHFAKQSLAMYQCEHCGRLWIQEEPYSSQYRPFYPEGEWRDTLAVQKAVPLAQDDHRYE